MIVPQTVAAVRLCLIRHSDSVTAHRNSAQLARHEQRHSTANGSPLVDLRQHEYHARRVEIDVHAPYLFERRHRIDRGTSISSDLVDTINSTRPQRIALSRQAKKRNRRERLITLRGPSIIEPSSLYGLK